MMKKVEKAKLHRLICQSLRSLCEAGLPDSTNISIEGLIGITVNSDQVILVGVHEEIGDSEVEMIDAMKDGSGGGKSSSYHQMSGFNAKILQQQHAAMLHEHMMQVMQAGMQAALPPTPDKSLRQFTKSSVRATPEGKSAFRYSPFDESDDEDLPQTAASTAYNLTSSPQKSVSSAGTETHKESYPFTNYNQGLFSPATAKSTATTEEAQSSAQSVTNTSSSKNNGSVSKSITAITPNSEQDQAASTITITPVVESPKPDESEPMPKPQSPMLENPLSSISEYGRRLGTLTAVKQEGSTRRRISKSQQLAEEVLRVEEISDSDSNIAQNCEKATQDPMVGGIVMNSSTSPTPGGSSSVSPHHLAEVEMSSASTGGRTGTTTLSSAISPGGVVIHNIMDEHQIPPEAIMEIDSLDSEDQRHDYVDLDNSLLQILPDMGTGGDRLMTTDGSVIHEVVEIDDSDEVKGEPSDSKDSTDTKHNTDSTSKLQTQVLLQLQKKMAAQQVGKTGSTDQNSETVDLSQERDDYDETFMPPYMGRGFGRGSGFRRGSGGFGRFFRGFGGRGMFGRGGGAFLGRGGHHHHLHHGMMGFGGGGHHSFFHHGGGEKKTQWKCKLCGTIFNSKTVFESHMLKHENKGHGDAGLDESIGMACPYCKKRFRYKSWLEQHITTHTKEKLFHCPYCSKAYTRRRNVRKHIQMFHPEVLMGQMLSNCGVGDVDDNAPSLQMVKQQDPDDGDT